MSEPQDATSVVDNPDEGRFELHLDEGLAYLSYTRMDGHLYILHTEVPAEAEGRGLGGRLVQAALDEARRSGVRVVPFCPFAQAYVRRHPEYGDLVAQA